MCIRDRGIGRPYRKAIQEGHTGRPCSKGNTGSQQMWCAPLCTTVHHCAPRCTTVHRCAPKPGAAVGSSARMMARVHGWCGAHERKRGFEEELRVDGGARLEARESERAHEGPGNGKAQVDGVVLQWEEAIVGAPYNASCGGSGLGLWWGRLGL
eukprot:3100014-Prymnesium_polylepis.4